MAKVQKIAAALAEADLIVMTSPADVMHTTGAIIITQFLGSGGKSAAKDIRDSLSW